MGRPRKDATLEETVALAPKKDPVAVPSVSELAASIDFSDLDIGPVVEDIKMGTRPAIVTEAHLKEEKTKAEPANPTLALARAEPLGKVQEVTARVSNTDLELIKSYFTELKQAQTHAAPPVDLTMFKAWQDMANKKFVELSGMISSLESKVDDLTKTYIASQGHSALLEGAVNSLRLTVIDFLDALNQNKVLVNQDNVVVTKSEPPKQVEGAEGEELGEEIPFVPNNPDYPAAALGNPQALFNASEKLPPKILETIKGSVNKGTPKLWSKTFSPNISKKFPDVTENDVFAWLVSLNALDAQGNMDPDKL